MKLTDYTRPSKTPEFLQGYLTRLQAWLPFLFNEKTAHEHLVARLQRELDNRFILLKNLPLLSIPALTPYVLLGPPGPLVLGVSTQKGIFRARDESWWEMSKTSRRYQPARHNLIRQTQDLEQRLRAFLEQQPFSCPPILPVLLLIDPGVYVETSRPAVRIVLADGIKNLTGNLVQGDEVMSATQVQALADLLDRAARPEQAQEPHSKDEDFFGKDLVQPGAKPPLIEVEPVPQLNLPPVLEKLGLSRGQWVWIALLAVVTILVLGGLIFLVLFTA